MRTKLPASYFPHAPYIGSMKLKLIYHEEFIHDGSVIHDYTFRRDDGTEIDVEAWKYDYHGIDTISIPRIFEFAYWLAEQDFPDDLDIADYDTLDGIVSRFERKIRGWD